MERIYCLKPLINSKSAILILGTLPGPESDKRKEYYADHGNKFWAFIYSIFQTPMDYKYDQRCDFLLKHRIALWDVLESAERVGASDNTITNEIPNDLNKFIIEHPQIKRFLLHGTKAYNNFKQYNKHLYYTFPNIRVPSTSSTPGKYVKPLNERKKIWKVALSSVQ